MTQHQVTASNSSVSLQEFLAAKLHGRAKRHDVTRNLVNLGSEVPGKAHLRTMRGPPTSSEYEARIAALERLVGKQATGALCQRTGPPIIVSP